MPLYCFDPRQYALTPFGNPKTGAHRAQFLLESVLDLKASLRSIGSDLLIHLGRPEDVMSGACVAPAGAGSAYTHTAQALHLHAWRPAPGLALPPTRAPSPAQALCSRQPPGRSRPVRDLYARATEAHTVQAAAWHGARPGRRCAADLFPAPVGAAAARRGASWRRPRPPARRRAWSAPCGAPCATAPGWRALHAHSACVARGSPHVVLRASLPGVDMHLYAREVARREGVRVVLACGGRSVHVPTCPHASTEESVARL